MHRLFVLYVDKAHSLLNTPCHKNHPSVLSRGLLGLPHLRNLEFQLSCFEGEQFSVLRELTDLTSLVVASSQTLTREAARHITAIASLQALRLSNSLFPGGDLLGSKLSKLTCLDLQNAALGLGCGSDLLFLQQLPALESLSLAACRYLTTRDFLGLRYAQQLKLLNISCLGESATDALMQSVARLHSLTKLILCSSPWFTEAGLLHISSLSNLVSLDLCSCNALQSESFSLELIHPLSLKVLDLSFCNWLTDEGLERISAFEGLEELVLTFCQNISVQGVKRLFQSKLKLARLNILSCKLNLSGQPWFEDALSYCVFVGARGR